MIVLDYRDRRPLYEQVAERLQEMMFNGVLPQDAQLPSAAWPRTCPLIPTRSSGPTVNWNARDIFIR